ncbi:MAG: FKBP-type peptidyl-prolyl cis-trans isomerase [Janthinobacterium lividum]
MRARHGFAVALIAAATIAAAPVTLPGGTIVTDVKVGTGAVAAPGSIATVHYTGWLETAGKRGKKFDSSRDRNEPFNFAVGSGQVIAGWDDGIVGMKVGGKRTLTIPAARGYGDDGAGADIPPGATLIFDIELLGIQ